MGHSLGDGIIVMALAGALVAWLYFRHAERRRRMEIVHQERLAAMEKGIPLAELPPDPATIPRTRDPRAPLIHGIVWLALGGGAVLTMMLWPIATPLWPLPLPMVLLGIGLVLFYFLGSRRAR